MVPVVPVGEANDVWGVGMALSVVRLWITGGLCSRPGDDRFPVLFE